MIIRRPALQLCLCGAAALFWELLLIRWLGSCIRIVGYFTNVILISAFFGLGAGALLVRFRTRTWHGIVRMLAFCAMLGPLLGMFQHSNPGTQHEYVWIGGPLGIVADSQKTWTLANIQLPYWLVLAIVYFANASVFAMFGQWLGTLFSAFKPLKAYTLEIAGSMLGIVLFAIVSYSYLPPGVWFAVGFILILLILDVDRPNLVRAGWYALLVVIALTIFSSRFLWSRYYKISLTPLTRIGDIQQQRILEFDRPIGWHLTVNNDYHQMILDLRPRDQEPPFLASWRWLYDYPYQDSRGRVPEGRTLIVGAGSGNDVSAAVRAGESAIDAVEIDPLIIEIGRRYHPEHPYDQPAVHVVIDDARSYFATTDHRYSKVVFGFLDSHTLMSSFSSLRLDNFVYTREAMQRVKELLVPGGKVYLTFAANTPWLHKRLVSLLDQVFDQPTQVAIDRTYRYANGVVYINGRSAEPVLPSRAQDAAQQAVRVPTDNWPFLYLKESTLPPHYLIFIILVVVSGFAALLLLPRGERRVKIPYFCMGTGFFLIETSNVVSLSLLYGSTWIVNIAVFTGILGLILLGNMTCMAMARPRYHLLFPTLVAGVLLAYFTPTASLLRIDHVWLQAIAAVAVFLGPVYLASLIFGHLIKRERSLYQAYGSNLLGAVVGGAVEYLSLVTGLKALLLITLACYVLAYAALVAAPDQSAA